MELGQLILLIAILVGMFVLSVVFIDRSGLDSVNAQIHSMIVFLAVILGWVLLWEFLIQVAITGPPNWVLLIIVTEISLFYSFFQYEWDILPNGRPYDILFNIFISAITAIFLHSPRRTILISSVLLTFLLLGTFIWEYKNRRPDWIDDIVETIGEYLIYIRTLMN